MLGEEEKYNNGIEKLENYNCNRVETNENTSEGIVYT